MLNWLTSLSIMLVLMHPYKNFLSVSRLSTLLILLVLIISRLSLNKCKYNSLVALGNILILGTFTALLFIFSNPKYLGIRYIVTLGQFLNLIALLFNRGRMPVVKKVLEQRDIQLLPDNPLHSIENEHSRMLILNDRIYVPILSYKIISIGDVLTDIGIIITAVHLYLF